MRHLLLALLFILFTNYSYSQSKIPLYTLDTKLIYNKDSLRCQNKIIDTLIVFLKVNGDPKRIKYMHIDYGYIGDSCRFIQVLANIEKDSVGLVSYALKWPKLKCLVKNNTAKIIIPIKNHQFEKLNCIWLMVVDHSHSDKL
ncbi:MAG TPA: hypothetical protein VK890_11230, partial [Bacteroidia bacterium]|nr:hypothetical protein [Bacteroidia bacterium]